MDILRSLGGTALTTLLSLIVMFLLTKLMGSKQVSQMTLFDYVVGITIGSIAAELATELEDPERPLLAMVLWGLAAWGISVLGNKSLRARAFLSGKPLVLLDQGVIRRDNLKRARLDLNEFLTYCRIAGYFDLSEIQTAVLEHNGSVSFLPKETDRPATPAPPPPPPPPPPLPLPFIFLFFFFFFFPLPPSDRPPRPPGGSGSQAQPVPPPDPLHPGWPPPAGKHRQRREGDLLGPPGPAAPGLPGGGGRPPGPLGRRGEAHRLPHVSPEPRLTPPRMLAGRGAPCRETTPWPSPRR